MQPATFFFHDDGSIPNSRFPVLLYRQAFSEREEAGADWLEKRFAANNWTEAWRDGIYNYHHYHSTAHEVLGIYGGSARLKLGGEHGQIIEVMAGDILIIPAGVGHKNLESKDLKVVGAYDGGRDWDVNRGKPGERPRADQNIAALPTPKNDPLLGEGDGLPLLWI